MLACRSSPTTESADSSSRSSFPTHIKVPSDTASTSSPVTTLVVAPSATGVTDEFASATNASATPTPVSAAANANNGYVLGYIFYSSQDLIHFIDSGITSLLVRLQTLLFTR